MNDKQSEALTTSILALIAAIIDYTAKAYPEVKIVPKSQAEYGVAVYGETDGEREGREYLRDLDAKSAARAQRRPLRKP